MKRVLRDPSLSQKIRLRIVQVCVYPVLMFGAEIWSLTAAEQDKLDAAGRRAQRFAVRRTYPDVIPNIELTEMTRHPPLTVLWAQRVGRYAGLSRMGSATCLTRETDDRKCHRILSRLVSDKLFEFEGNLACLPSKKDH